MIVTYVLTCDGAEGKVFRYDSKDCELTFVHELSGPHLLDREIGSDRPGRSFDSEGFNRHSYESRSSPHELEKETFVKSVVHWLDDARQKKSFDSVIFIAPPHILGYLRKMQSKGLEKLVAAEVTKDLTKATSEKILSEVLPILRPIRALKENIVYPQ